MGLTLAPAMRTAISFGPGVGSGSVRSSRAEAGPYSGRTMARMGLLSAGGECGDARTGREDSEALGSRLQGFEKGARATKLRGRGDPFEGAAGGAPRRHVVAERRDERERVVVDRAGEDAEPGGERGRPALFQRRAR